MSRRSRKVGGPIDEWDDDRPPENVAQVAEHVWESWGKRQIAVDAAWRLVEDVLDEQPELADDPAGLMDAVRRRNRASR